METIQMSVAAKVKEAEAYRSMGLLDDSLVIYEQVLSSEQEIDNGTKDTIEEKISEIKNEIEDLIKSDMQSVSDEDIAFFKNKLSITEDIPHTIDSAAAFKELGLFKEALAEYEKLLQKDYPWHDIIPDIATCLLKCCGPSEIVKHTQDMVNDKDIDNTDKGEMIFRLALEMEKRDLKTLADELYKSAGETDPENEEIKSRVSLIGSHDAAHSKYDHLVNQDKITVQQLQQVLAQSKKSNKSVEFILLEHFNIKIDDLGKSLSLFYNRPFKIYDPELRIPSELLRNLKKPFLLNYVWVPLAWGKDGIEVLIDDPKDLSKTDQIRSLMKTDRISFSVGIKEHIEEFINRFFDETSFKEDGPEQTQKLETDAILDISFEEEEPEPVEEEVVDGSSSQIVRLLDQVIIAGFRKNISDIHIEPFPEAQCVNIRFRMDGMCQDYLKVPLSMARGMISRIKIMAHLDIAERRLPQDGKIKFKRKGLPAFELRVATLPTAGGFEDAVLRILAKANALALDETGLTEAKLNAIKNIISQPYGLVLVVGPTGSGKTTTLHSALGYINKPGIKIWTAEDPVEITQPRLRQVEAKPRIGLDFSRIMRAFLRADPDVIMIGEMRDQETASTGLEAALTGHLVFSTLHTNNASETITRLFDMGFNPIYFADALLGVLAQRLVRRLCPECKEAFHPSQQQLEEIVSEYGRDHFDASGIDLTADIVLYRCKGCEHCSDIGYSGRLAIHELLENNLEIKNLIKNKENTETIAKVAIKSGMTTLKQDGILKVFNGLTDLNEVRRVCIK